MRDWYTFTHTLMNALTHTLLAIYPDIQFDIKQKRHKKEKLGLRKWNKKGEKKKRSKDRNKSVKSRFMSSHNLSVCCSSASVNVVAGTIIAVACVYKYVLLVRWLPGSLPFV